MSDLSRAEARDSYAPACWSPIVKYDRLPEAIRTAACRTGAAVPAAGATTSVVPAAGGVRTQSRP